MQKEQRDGKTVIIHLSYAYLCSGNFLTDLVEINGKPSDKNQSREDISYETKPGVMLILYASISLY